MNLKYGMNPYQQNAAITMNRHLKQLNGNPSVINVLDAREQSVKKRQTIRLFKDFIEVGFNFAIKQKC